MKLNISKILATALLVIAFIAVATSTTWAKTEIKSVVHIGGCIYLVTVSTSGGDFAATYDACNDTFGRWDQVLNASIGGGGTHPYTPYAYPTNIASLLAASTSVTGWGVDTGVYFYDATSVLFKHYTPANQSQATYIATETAGLEIPSSYLN